MFWPGMVLNQGQLSIVVSDWESYLGSPFPPSVWVVNFVRGIHSPVKRHGRFVLLATCLKKEEYVRSTRSTLVRFLRRP